MKYLITYIETKCFSQTILSNAIPGIFLKTKFNSEKTASKVFPPTFRRHCRNIDSSLQKFDTKKL